MNEPRTETGTVLTPNPVHVCLPPYDDYLLEPLDNDDLGRVGWLVRRIGPWRIEIHNMMVNLRLVIAEARLHGTAFEYTGHGWCYPKEIGVLNLAAYAWAWDIDVKDPGAADPPGPWIKAIHTGYYRQPRFNQPGPDGVINTERRSIQCPRCERVSYSPQDVAESYCGACHQFHAQMREVP